MIPNMLVDDDSVFRLVDFDPFADFEESDITEASSALAARALDGRQLSSTFPRNSSKKCLLNRTSGRLFANEDLCRVRLVCFVLIPATISTTLILPYVLVRSVYRLFLVHSRRTFAVALLRLALVPVVPLLFLLAAFYGLLCPRQGRAIYGMLEWLFYGWGIGPARCAFPRRYDYSTVAEQLKKMQSTKIVSNKTDIPTPQGFLGVQGRIGQPLINND
jgi:hypothetical protein